MNASELSRIKTIVIVMMENRSFDHVLGHMSVPPFGDRADIDGLRPDAWTTYANGADGERPHFPFAMRADQRFEHGLPHHRPAVTTQLGGALSMDGFVRAYYADSGDSGLDHPPPMAFCTKDVVPVTRFLADNFTVCNRWFAPLPTSTLPNRLMAFSGDTRTHDTLGVPVRVERLVFDWLDAHEVSWRVYHSGLFSFFTLLMRTEVLGPSFRRFSSLASDLANGDLPEVVIIEPSYYDAPHLFGANDNHSPLQIGPGEAFQRDIYRLLSSSSAWKDMVIVFTYDEHGGFFDHVAPLAIPYAPPAGATFAPFTTTGPRVPTILASPFAPKGTCDAALDHTSILQLLAERFDPTGSGYSDSVNARKRGGIESLAAALQATADVALIDSPPIAPEVSFRVESVLGARLEHDAARAFRTAGTWLLEKFPEESRAQLPELWHVLKP